MERTATAAEGPIYKKMTELRLACRREIQIRRQRAELAERSLRDSLRLIKSKAEENLENREKLSKLENYLRKLETDLSDASAVQIRKEAKYKAIAESVSTTIARTKQLEKEVQVQRARKDEYAALISQQLLSLEALEEKGNDDLAETEAIEEAIGWYRRVLGFRTEGGEGIKFIFDNIDLNNPEQEYLFTVRLDGDRYTLMDCDPYVEDVNELIKDLNKTNDFFKFVRIMREKFQAAIQNGTLHASSSVIQDLTSTTVSSPPPVSVDSRNGTPTKENPPHSQHKKARLKSRQRVTHGQVVTPSPQSILNRRQSPRFSGSQLPRGLQANLGGLK